jgi:multidrug efflux system membrane fusion protein
VIKVVVFLVIATFGYSASYSGIVQPIKKVNLSLAIDGIIKEIKVKEGKIAKKGGVILSLDDKIKQIEVKRVKTLLENDTEIFYLQKELKIAKNMYQKSKELFEKTSSISKNELNNFELKYYSLESKLSKMKSDKQMQKIEYDLEREKLKKYKLTAPFDGVVTKVTLDVGEWGQRGEPIVEYIDSGVCFVETNIKESQIRDVKLNKIYTISINRGDSVIEKKGKVTYISPIVDSSSGLILVKIEFDNRDLDIIPGVIATINIDKSE